MENSILNDVKKMLGIDSSYTHFDLDLIILINSALATLAQLGVGPAEGFSITSSDEVWSDFLEEAMNLEMVKEYVYLKVRLIFDPPSSGGVIEAYRNEIAELEWRINSQVDYEW